MITTTTRKLTINKLSDLLFDGFDDSSLQNFCFQYFDEVHKNFASGQDKRERNRALIQYCQEDKLSKLL